MDALKLSVLMLCTVIFLKTAEGLRCYNCVSLDGADPACEIPLDPTSSSVTIIDCDEVGLGTGEKHCAFTKDDGSVLGFRSYARTCMVTLLGLPANACTSASGATVCYCNDKDLCNDDEDFCNHATNTDDKDLCDAKDAATNTNEDAATNTNEDAATNPNKDAATNNKIAIPLVVAMILINFIF